MRALHKINVRKRKEKIDMNTLYTWGCFLSDAGEPISIITMSNSDDGQFTYDQVHLIKKEFKKQVREWQKGDDIKAFRLKCIEKVNLNDNTKNDD